MFHVGKPEQQRGGHGSRSSVELSIRDLPATQNERQPRKPKARKSGKRLWAIVAKSARTPVRPVMAIAQRARERSATCPGSVVGLPSDPMTGRLTVGSSRSTSTAIATAMSTLLTTSEADGEAAKRVSIASIRLAESACMMAVFDPKLLNGVAKLTPASAASSLIENSAVPLRRRRRSAASKTPSRFASRRDDGEGGLIWVMPLFIS